MMKEAFKAATALEAVREFQRRYFTERSAPATLELFTEEPVWFGSSEIEHACGLQELRALLDEDVASAPTPMRCHVRECREVPISPDLSLVSTVVFVTQENASGATLCLRVIYTCARRDGGWKIASAHGSVPSALQGEGEYFPVSFAEEKQKLLRNEIIETTISVLEYQDIYAWEYDITQGLCLCNERIRRKFGLKPGDNFTPAQAAEGGVVAPRSAEEWLSLFRAIEEGEKEAAAEIRCCDAVGVEAPYRIKITAVSSDDGKPRRAICCARDLSDSLAQERRRNEMLASALIAAKEADRAKEEFLSRMSHEIRTPLNAIAGMADLARDSLGDEGEIADKLEKITRSSRFLLSLVDDMLDISAMRRGGVILKEEDFSARELMETVGAAICPLAAAKGVVYDADFTPVSGRAFKGDCGKIAQILINLLGNAVKFTDRGGKVFLHAALHHGAKEDRCRLRFSVRDTGRGIAEEFIPRIYEPFTQEKLPEGRENDGVGLGLPIARSIAEMMGGALECRSIEKVGTEFTFTLPIAAGAGESSPRAGGLRGRAILIAGAEEETRAVIAAVLAQEGAQAESVAGLAEALPKIEKGRYDAVVIARNKAGGDFENVCACAARKCKVIVVNGGEKAPPGAVAILREPLFGSALAAALRKLFLPPEAPEPEASELEGRAPLAGRRILVAEDRPLNMAVIEGYLRRMGCETEGVADGVAALERFARSPEGWYSAIVMDVRMPVMDGLAAARAIRTMGRADAAAVPILAVTAQAFEKDAEAALAAGMNAHLAKPVDEKELRAAMEKYVIGANKNTVAIWRGETR